MRRVDSYIRLNASETDLEKDILQLWAASWPVSRLGGPKICKKKRGKKLQVKEYGVSARGKKCRRKPLKCGSQHGMARGEVVAGPVTLETATIVPPKPLLESPSRGGSEN